MGEIRGRDRMERGGDALSQVGEMQDDWRVARDASVEQSPLTFEVRAT